MHHRLQGCPSDGLGLRFGRRHKLSIVLQRLLTTAENHIQYADTATSCGSFLSSNHSACTGHNSLHGAGKAVKVPIKPLDQNPGQERFKKYAQINSTVLTVRASGGAYVPLHYYQIFSETQHSGEKAKNYCCMTRMLPRRKIPFED